MPVPLYDCMIKLDKLVRRVAVSIWLFFTACQQVSQLKTPLCNLVVRQRRLLYGQTAAILHCEMIYVL